MAAAIALARRGLGRVWPNPAVGCVIVRSGRVVGRGWTQAGGRPHAETEALARAGAAAKGGTAYVSLEPCAHTGQTPPCSAALIEAGIARVVVACSDPDPRVCGAGIAALESAGVTVTLGCEREAAERLNAGFFRRVRDGRPLVTLKLATTLDGRIATHSGESQWITGESARMAAHQLRLEHDAVLVGVGTAATDDPRLTCRLPGAGASQPVRAVLDGHLRLSLTGKLVRSAHEIPLWILTSRGADQVRANAYRACGAEIVEIPVSKDGYIDLHAALRALGERGLTRVLVEGGRRVSAAFLRAGLVDRLAWFRAPSIMGGDGLPAVAGMGIGHLDAMVRFRRTGIRRVGDDLIEFHEAAAQTI